MLEADHYFLLLCDVQKSTQRSVDAGTALLHQLDTALREIKAKFPSAFTLGPELNYGDEISGLLLSPAISYDLMAQLRAALWGTARLRCVCVYGQIGARADRMTQLGGLIFKNANAAMTQLKKTGRFAVWDTGAPDTDRILTALTNLIDAQIRSMTAYQYSVYQLMAAGASQTEVAEQLGKYQQSVSDAVARANIDLIIEAEDAVRASLAALAGRLDQPVSY